MSRNVRLLTALGAAIVLAGCAREMTKPNLPPNTVVKTEVVTVEVARYVPIKPELTREHPIAEGPLNQCPVVASARKQELIQANGKLREISLIQGTVVNPVPVKPRKTGE